MHVQHRKFLVLTSKQRNTIWRQARKIDWKGLWRENREQNDFVGFFEKMDAFEKRLAHFARNAAQSDVKLKKSIGAGFDAEIECKQLWNTFVWFFATVDVFEKRRVRFTRNAAQCDVKSVTRLARSIGSWWNQFKNTLTQKSATLNPNLCRKLLYLLHKCTFSAEFSGFWPVARQRSFQSSSKCDILALRFKAHPMVPISPW